MSSILDISSMYNQYSTELSSVSANSASSALKGVNEDSTDEELMDACKSFEAYFVQKMIEAAKKTVENEDEQGEYMQYFGDTLNQAYAEMIADSGQMGLAQQLYDSVKTQYNL